MRRDTPMSIFTGFVVILAIIVTVRASLASLPVGKSAGELASSSYDTEPAFTIEYLPGDEPDSSSDTSASSSEEVGASATANTLTSIDGLTCTNYIFYNSKTGEALLQSGQDDRISPASMTKVLTILVALENTRAATLDDKVEMTIEPLDYAYQNDCSIVGYSVGDTPTVRELLYGTILPSGADAAYALATYVGGTYDNFISMMNDWLAAHGMSETTHMTNAVGIYDENHYSTVSDMAKILQYALQNDTAKEVLSAHTYTTAAIAAAPEGIELSNWFLRRIEDHVEGCEVVCAKTGFVSASMYCCVSYGTDTSGNEYICCSIGSGSSWNCIYDHAAMYNYFAKTAS